MGHVTHWTVFAFPIPSKNLKLHEDEKKEFMKELTKYRVALGKHDFYIPSLYKLAQGQMTVCVFLCVRLSASVSI